MDRVKLYISSISYSDRDVYALILAEVGKGNRNLPIVIRKEEALMISYYIEKKGLPRPLTYDLITKIIEDLGAEVMEVSIVKLHAGVFYADLALLKDNGEILHLDARVSDAIAIALRSEVPIYCNETVMKAASFTVGEEVVAEAKETEEETPTNPKQTSLDEYSLKQLQALMQEAVQNENYELAAQLKNELENRNKN